MSYPVATREFAGAEVRLIDLDGEYHMTAEELGRCLGYEGDDKAVRELVNRLARRNEDEIEGLRTAVKLAAVDGKHREAWVYHEDALYVLACLSKAPNAVAFRQWIRRTCRDLRRGDKVMVSRDEFERLISGVAMLAEGHARMASAAASILSTRRWTRPKDDPRQTFIDFERTDDPQVEAGDDPEALADRVGPE